MNHIEDSCETENSEHNNKLNESDIKLVMAQTSGTREQVITALQNHNGDILGAILEVTSSK